MFRRAGWRGTGGYYPRYYGNTHIGRLGAYNGDSGIAQAETGTLLLAALLV